MPRAAIATAASVLLVGGVILAVVLLGPRQEPGGANFSPSPSLPAPSPATATASPATTPPATESAAASRMPTPTASPTHGPFAVEWTPTELPGAAPAVQSILWLDERIIVAGRDGVEAAVWLSDDDGATWRRSTITSTRAEHERTSFGEVVEVDGVLVGVGWWGAAESDQFAWMTWRSTDGGSHWSEHRDETQPYAMRAATVQEQLVVGVGWTYAGTVPFDSWIAVSHDGLTWRRVDSDTMRRSQVDAIASLGNRLVAVGRRYPEASDDTCTPRQCPGVQPTAWLSDDDGASWRAVAMGTFAEAVHGFASDLVIRADGSLIAVGSSLTEVEDATPTAWISTDGGETWRVENMGAQGAGAATAIAATDRGLIALGALEPYNRGPVASYTSEDGILWMTADRATDDDGYVHVAGADGARVLAGLTCAFQDPCPTALMSGSVRELDQ